MNTTKQEYRMFQHGDVVEVIKDESGRTKAGKEGVVLHGEKPGDELCNVEFKDGKRYSFYHDELKLIREQVVTEDMIKGDN